MLRCTILMLIILVTGSLFLQEAKSCNEAVCGSIVSKCLLTQSCKCDFERDCSCCKECSYCLSYLYDECCSCVGMCPKANNTNALKKQSHVEDLDQELKVTQLFSLLTQAPDALDRWKSVTYPVDYSILLVPSKNNDIKYHLQSVEQEVVPIKPNVTTLNCTVAYITDCMSWRKCRNHCQSMGASSIRWFNDGCCECIGENCINYGINESRCLKCSAKVESDDLSDGLLDDDKDYGEDGFDDDYSDDDVTN